MTRWTREQGRGASGRQVVRGPNPMTERVGRKQRRVPPDATGRAAEVPAGPAGPGSLLGSFRWAGESSGRGCEVALGTRRLCVESRRVQGGFPRDGREAGGGSRALPASARAGEQEEPGHRAGCPVAAAAGQRGATGGRGSPPPPPWVSSGAGRTPLAGPGRADVVMHERACTGVWIELRAYI